MAKVQIDITAADKASKTIHNVAGSFTELKSGIDLAMGAAGQIIDMTKQVYDLGKAGAELQYAEVRFERLAERINTTGDALLGKLHDATEGTLSDAQLMAGAGDLMSLGLAKSEDQVIRLSRVIAGLGMDMNQLVLTMSNQTTMRFDQLGVAVDGFDEKVENLKKTGMSANDAFNEAFLQQAEEQLEKVGNKADEAIGSFQRFEASLANYKESVQKNAVGPTAQIVDYLNDLIERWTFLQKLQAGGFDASQYARGNKAIADIARSTSAYTDRLQGLADAQTEVTEAVEESIEPIDTSAMAAWDAEQAAKAAADAYDEYWEGVKKTAQAQDELKEAIVGARVELINAKAAFKAETGGDIAGDLEQAFEDGKISAEQYEGALQIIDTNSGTHLLTDKKMADAQAELVQKFIDSKGNLEQFKDGLANFHDVWEPFNEDIEAAQRKIGYLQDQLERLDGTYYINVVFQHGSWDPDADWTPPDDNSPRASGGPVSYGTPYLVGERGPELFVPNANGRIVDNQTTRNMIGGGSGAGGNTYNLTIRTEQSPRVVQRGFAIERALAGV